MKKKINYVVSYSKNFWKQDLNNLFISDPYIHHLLEKEEKTKSYKFNVASYLRNSKNDLNNDSIFVDDKYEKYIKILSNRLNKIHNKRYSERFWKKSLSMGFIRYITSFYNLFKTSENYFQPDIHDCNVLSPKSYFTPNDFEEHRSIFENSGFGQEQIFSIYLNLFYPNKYNHIISQVFKLEKPSLIKKIKNNYKIKSFYYKLKYGSSNSEISMGILGSYFSSKNISNLIKKSKQRIGLLNIPLFNYKNNPLNNTKRKILSKFEKDFDRFDKFFFKSLFYCFPKIFIEDFVEIESLFKKRLNELNKLRYIISENWISDTQNSIFIAFSQEFKIKHISNEHNCFFHPFAGSYLNHVIDMSDFFTTLGWEDFSNKKIIKSGSLFEFSIKKNKIKKNNILFISGAIASKTPHFSGAYGYCEEKAINSIHFNITFFNSLTKKTLRQITYRGYPYKNISHIQLFDKEHFYGDIYSEFNHSNKGESAKKQMGESKLVIVDYISTAHLESIIMNIPTIFFWDKKSYYLNDKFHNYFDPLIKAGICQTSPEKAAKLIEKVKDDPKSWWFSDKVQTGKDIFISKNIGNPKLLFNFLINLLK